METPYDYDYEMSKIVNDRGRLIGLRGSTNDGHPVLVLDRSDLALITDWDPDGSSRRGRGRGRGPHPPMPGEFDDGQQGFFAAMANMANTIQEGIAAANAAHAAAAIAAGGGGGPAGDRPMTLASFLKINPPTFRV
ncbi:hypothetical protein PIB30_101245 [Stylosanthes scabra]|uniref:Uncharacterized protein n=1 Tax=Stylosanthes scabra TaxID=79078 RepID=A0ABU6QY39_9FABA|nr:hypothetical protein [Stylosanthes scabra]